MRPIELSPPETWARMQAGAVYLDVRTDDEFCEGHPPAARHLPFATRVGGALVADPLFSQRAVAMLGLDEEIVLACARGGRARQAFELLRGAGFSRLFLMPAGWEGAQDAFGSCTTPGWKASGLPVVIGV